VWVALFGGHLASLESSDGDETPAPSVVLSQDLSSEELEQLKASLGLPSQFRSLISTAPIPFAQLLDAVPPEKISTLSSAERLIAQKLVVRSFQNLGKKMSDLVKSVNHYTCPSFADSKSLRISTLSVLHFERIHKSLSEFMRIFALWYKGVPRRFKQDLEELTATPDERQTILSNAQSVSADFLRFAEGFEAQSAFIETELQEYQCNIKDFLGFYEALFRFYTVYTVVPQTTTRDVRLTELTVEWVLWQRRLMEVVDILRLFRTLIFEFGEFLDHARSKPDSPLVLSFQDINIRMLGQITSKFKRLNKASERFVDYFRVLRKTIAGLEHSVKWDLPPLQYPKSAWLVRAGVLLLVILRLI